MAPAIHMYGLPTYQPGEIPPRSQLFYRETVYPPTMGIPPVAETICRMATDFYECRDVSMIDLLRSSGYVQDPSAITEQHLEEVFRAYPDLINAWVRLSEDKRIPEGWYLRSAYRSTAWKVGRVPKNTEELRFKDQFKACAFFVKQEVELYRVHACK